MSERDKTLYVILISLILVLGWVFIVFAPLRSQIQRTEMLIGRKMNRIETRAAVPDAVGGSEPKLQAQFDELQARKAVLEAQVAQYETRFVSLDTVDGIKALRLEISTLAEETGLEVLRFGQLANNTEVTDSMDAVRSQIRQPYGRPFLKLTARGSFGNLTDFVDRIGQIEQATSVMWLRVEAPSFAEIERNPAVAANLMLEMELAL